MATISKHLLQNVMASRMLDIVKMRGVVPCDVEDARTGFKNRVVEVVFDPLRIDDLDAEYCGLGYVLDDELHVLAKTADDGILAWGGINSVYHLKKGDRVVAFEDHMAFNDVLGLTRRFNFKHTKAEVDALVAQLKAKYTPA